MGCLLFIQLQCSAGKSTWDKPHLRPLALCVSLEVEAEGRIGVQVLEGVGLVTGRSVPYCFFEFFLLVKNILINFILSFSHCIIKLTNLFVLITALLSFSMKKDY